MNFFIGTTVKPELNFLIKQVGIVENKAYSEVFEYYLKRILYYHSDSLKEIISKETETEFDRIKGEREKLAKQKQNVLKRITELRLSLNKVTDEKERTAMHKEIDEKDKELSKINDGLAYYHSKEIDLKYSYEATLKKIEELRFIK